MRRQRLRPSLPRLAVRLGLAVVGTVWLARTLISAAGASPHAWQQRSLHRVAPLAVSTTATDTGFRLMAPSETGVTFTNSVRRESSLTNSVINNGSGVALGDVNGDGWSDVFLCGIERGNALYLNHGGWRFHDATAESGFTLATGSNTGAAFADVDGDGDLDLLATALGFGARLYRNDGRGRFALDPGSGLVPRFGAMSMALADVDGDGDLDLYVANYRTRTIQDQPGTRYTVLNENGQFVVKAVNGRPVDDLDYRDRFDVGPGGEVIENGEPDILYLNDGRGHFDPVSWTSGQFLDDASTPLVKPPRDWGLSAMFRDLNVDGLPDLYVCNDADSPDRIWLNRGAGRFAALAAEAVTQTSLSSMGVDVADVDGDGDMDLFVADMLAREHADRHRQLSFPRPLPASIGDRRPRLQVPRNTLLVNQGDGEFIEAAFLSGVHASDWSWTPIFLDVDLDGLPDLLVATGFHRDVRDRDHLERIATLRTQGRLGPAEELRYRADAPAWPSSIAAFQNAGELHFHERSTAWGFHRPVIAQGMAVADLDADGDLDLVANQFNGEALLWRNEASGARIAVRLRGRAPNTQGVGSLIQLARAERVQTREVIAGGRYLSHDDGVHMFAAPRAGGRLEVLWRSGKRTRIEPVEPDHIYEIEEPK